MMFKNLQFIKVLKFRIVFQQVKKFPLALMLFFFSNIRIFKTHFFSNGFRRRSKD